MKRGLAALLAGLLAAPPALAHVDIGLGGGFLVGLLHPVLGFDHFLAMISVGILSVQIGGRAVWMVPSTFVAVMAIGGVLGFNAVQVPLVEVGIALSVLALGVALAAGRKFPILASLGFVAFFAVFHGHAHGNEIPTIADPYLYALGFVSGTALIHLMGVATGFIARRPQWGLSLLRYVGAGIAGIGFHILVGA